MANVRHSRPNQATVVCSLVTDGNSKIHSGELTHTEFSAPYIVLASQESGLRRKKAGRRQQCAAVLQAV